MCIRDSTWARRPRKTPVQLGVGNRQTVATVLPGHTPSVRLHRMGYAVDAHTEDVARRRHGAVSVRPDGDGCAIGQYCRDDCVVAKVVASHDGDRDAVRRELKLLGPEEDLS